MGVARLPYPKRPRGSQRVPARFNARRCVRSEGAPPAEHAVPAPANIAGRELRGATAPNAPIRTPQKEECEMPYQAATGREPVQGMPDAYYATPADLQTYHDAAAQLAAMRPATQEFDIRRNPNRYVYVAAFDGTGNDATQTIPERTNVHALYANFDRFIHGDADHPGFSRMHARYIEGPGTQNTWTNTLDNARGNSVEDRVWEVYKDLGDKARQWKQENPDAEISVITFGFSRGAIEAAEFAAVVGKYGIHANVGYRTQENDDHRHDTYDPEMGRQPDIRQFRELSGELVAPGKVPIAAGLFDPVATGVAENHDRMLPSNITTALQLTAMDEHRVLFPVNRIVTDEMAQSNPDRFANLSLAGCHSDIGGGYSQGKGLADINANLMSDYFNKVVGHEICPKVAPDPENFVVHDSNTPFFQRLGYLTTRYWYADRTQDAPSLQDGQHVRSGVDTNVTGRTMTALDSVHMHPGVTLDDGLRPTPPPVEARQAPREHDGHTPRPYAAVHSLQAESVVGPQRAPREPDVTGMLLESSARVSALMDRGLNPGTAQTLHAAAAQTDIRHSILSNGDSAVGRLSASVALAAREHGMDRIGQVTLSEDGRQLVITDRSDTHRDQVQRATVDIHAALQRSTGEAVFHLDRPLVQMGPKPQNLYEQAHAQLQGLPGAPQDRDALIEAAARVASQARHDGLTSIDRLVVQQGAAGPALIAHQDGQAPLATQPVAVQGFAPAQPDQQQLAQVQHGHGHHL